MFKKSDIILDETSYITYLNKLAQEDGSMFKVVEKKLAAQCPQLLSAIRYSIKHWTPVKDNICRAYLSLGLFRYQEECVRLACFDITISAEYQRDLLREEKKCSPYEGKESIFDNKILKEARREDLIDFHALRHVTETNLFKCGNLWGQYDSHINPIFFKWLSTCFNDNPSFVRVDPKGLYPTKPQEMLTECIIRTPNKDWWKDLRVYRGNHTGSSYVLLGDDTNNPQDWQDYHFKNVRMLQVVASRKDDDYLSMMIEELSEYYDLQDPSRHYVIGRMIHLDTYAKVGVPFEDAKLTHIDLAINLYINDDADTRMNQDLSNGEKTIKASRRTHILRVENIPFQSLFKFALAFFQSEYLTKEWLDAEFAAEDNPTQDIN